METNEEENDSSMEYVLQRSVVTKTKCAIILKGHDGETQFCCVECPLRFLEKEDLEKHLCTHNKEYRYICGICGTGLKRKEHLERHTLEHQEVRPHVCQECGKAFKRKEHLNIHKSVHGGDKNQVCGLCNKSFYRKDHLQKHLQTHSKMFLEQNLRAVTDDEVHHIKQEVDDSYSMVVDSMDGGEEYGPELEDENNLDNGTQIEPPVSEVGTNLRPFSCPICHKSYKRKDHLKIHSWSHKKKDKFCSQCGKAFHNEDQLLVHMTTHIKMVAESDRDGEPSYSSHSPLLVEASELFGISGNELLIPRQMQTSSPEVIHRAAPKSAYAESRPHQCTICLRRFKRRQHLKVHGNVHRKDQPTIWCSLCNEGFRSNSQFEEHVCLGAGDQESGEGELVPLEARKENKYPQEFVEVVEDMMESSQEEMPAERDIPVPQRVFLCKYCAKPFKRKDHYKIHLHIHTGIKTFFCPDCGKGFYRKDHLQKHALVHAKARPRPHKAVPALVPIAGLHKKPVRPEITIHAPSNAKLRVPLQIKVPYQVVMSMDNGEQRSVTIDPQDTAASS